ncbi:MAG: 25S rRNA (adenine645-N1)-methyltransferase [Heterodermia speciosa]|uniref:Ribosomal RNA-processing protein 8 n=1 Tax=Heterodermia speciosa TaxID=116794 RepID=A0A8H3F0P3_9LECA|nr:MAG: 25S rRNA (adenine645-N1)-methyltransferase [Heterodermia speciosa]
MFAAPGWSVSIDLLKAQEHPLGTSPQEHNAKEKGGQQLKRRKTGPKRSSRVDVTADNLAELWEKYVEGKVKTKTRGEKNDGTEYQAKKRRRKVEDQSTESPTALEKSLEQEDRVPEKQAIEEEFENVSREGKDEHVLTVKNAEKAATGQERSETGKANYEARIRKKKEKERLRASGEVPPPRPPRQSEGVWSSWTSVLEHTAKKANSEASMDAKTSKGEMSLSGSSFESPDAKLALQIQSTTEDPNAPHHPPPPTKPLSKRKTKPSPKNQPPPSSTPAPSSSAAKLPPPAPPAPLAASKLTPLQKKMRSRIISARFRHLNQTLYTTPSTQASALFNTNPSAYTSYHDGFRAQVAIWPQNPVETFIADIKIRGSAKREGLGAQKKAWRDEKKGKGKRGSGKEAAVGSVVGEGQSGEIKPLPRTNGICTIADLGCGDAALAAALLPSAGPKAMNLKLRSFDLAKGDGPNRDLVTVADTTALPLEDGAVDVAVLCLSLMGTNWVSCVDEACRVLRWGGEVWVAEIKSRFARIGKRRREGFLGMMKTGEGAKKGGKKRKRGVGGDDEEEEADNSKGETGDVIEVDSDPDILAPGKKGASESETTDVGAFVQVWRRRGFELQGEVDLENKMFVRMGFVKKGRPKEDHRALARDRAKGKVGAKAKFIDRDGDEEEAENEARVLKPCVYKLR